VLFEPARTLPNYMGSIIEGSQGTILKMRGGFMNSKRVKRIVFAGLLTGSLIVPAVPARAVDRQELKSDRREVRQDRKELRRDRRELRRDWRRGASPEEIARDRQEIRDGRAELRRDRQELKQDRRALRRD
jgi:hypothetical protein